MAVQMEAAEAAAEAQRSMKVKMAGAPPPPPPDPAEQAAQALLLKDAAEMVQREVELANMPPEGPNKNIGPQVQASANVVKQALDAAKIKSSGK
jgi:hypothetical protein